MRVIYLSSSILTFIWGLLTTLYVIDCVNLQWIQISHPSLQSAETEKQFS